MNNASALQTMHAYYNRLATGSASQHYLSYFHQKYLAGKQDIEIGSFGSGGGHLERTLVEMGFQAKSIQGYELNPTLVQSANEKAAAMGATHLSYQVADLNAPKLAPRSIDLGIFFHSLHHVTNLEICLGVVAEAIKDDGYLLIVDFVGKNYQQWSDEQIQYATDFLRILPAKYRLSMDGKLVKTKPRRPSIKEVIAGDPSEAVRSEDILVTLEQYFERLEFKSLGGSILNHVFDGIANNFDETKEGDVRLIHLLQGLEEWLESEGYISPDFVFAVYRPLGRTRMAS
ncbi:class I SAM-dependent methyltransferase [Cupriavidus gilardii]|uniref:Class I SAM-dependent methyltransferase n=1 Tax=Cupriavidus gilardii TaxID=82541 RepID=A0ABY4VQL4_9BURK|nr:methyltransferase domain-containing protein [Cupriavidus gilardii]USE79474.1 class I SAM-dependent methyltransferase [Cupriavidus gilardii]